MYNPITGPGKEANSSPTGIWIMSKTTIAMETAVSALLALRGSDAPPSARQRRDIDRIFLRILTLLGPRIRHFVRQYGLTAHREDAEQVCAIALHRALDSYDPAKAQFTTFINWMIRGELQGLRFRLMADQRPSARKVSATTISLDAMTFGGADEDGAGAAFLIEDAEAVYLTEASASSYLADNAITMLLDSYMANLRRAGLEQLSRRKPSRHATSAPTGQPRLKINAVDPDEIRQLDERVQRNRALVEQRLFSRPSSRSTEPAEEITKERARQISTRAAKMMVSIVDSDPRFAIMAAAAGRASGASAPPTPSPTTVRTPAKRPAPFGPGGSHTGSTLH